MKKLFFLLVHLSLITVISAQPVLKVTEIDQSKKYLQNGIVQKEFINSSMVDINSTLKIEIDTAQLFKFIPNRSDFKMPDKTSELIGFLTEVLQKQNQVISQFKRALQSYDPSDSVLVNQFNDALQNFGRFAQSIFRRDPIVRKYQNALPPKVGLAEGIFIAVGKRLEDLQAELSQLNAEKKASIQLGGWLHSKTGVVPIHLPGYDELPEKGYYSVSRWQIMPTDDQLKQLQQLQRLARENRDEGLNVINTMAQKTIDQLAEDISSLIDNNIKDIQAAFSAIKADIQSQALQNKMDNLVKDYTNLVQELQARIGHYQSSPAMKQSQVEVMAGQLLQDGQFLADGVAMLVSDMKAIETEIASLDISLRSKAGSLSSLVGAKIKAIANKTNLPEIKALVQGYKFDIASLDYSDKVLKLSVSAIPIEANLDLGTTGKRSEGDRILFKLNLITENDKSKTIDTRDISMYQLAAHFQGTVGVIFAHPTTATALTKKFQMAPYYNLLFKSVWPWTERYHRKSVMNNSFWDFSWGLHVSTPDFNKDDVPELGVGIAVSGIKDILQIGFAHNIFENKPYWFFGIRLPVPSMNFGGGAHTSGN